MRRWKAWWCAGAFGALSAAFSSPAHAFTHMVSQGETLASIAQRVYGDARREILLVGANGLDAQGGSAIVPGMRLDVPSPWFHKVSAGEAWVDLAQRYLGDPKRADVLARANQAVAWVPPVEGQEVLVPPVIAHLAAEGENVPHIAARYLADANKAWELDNYNGRKGTDRLVRGQIILVPLLDVSLTNEGKEEARRMGQLGEGGGASHEAQKRAESELPLLLSDVRGGRYVDAVARGNRALGYGDLTRSQQATIWRALLEAYVAVDAGGAAQGACEKLRGAVEGKALELQRLSDPRHTSPKIRAACGLK